MPEPVTGPPPPGVLLPKTPAQRFFATDDLLRETSAYLGRRSLARLMRVGRAGVVSVSMRLYAHVKYDDVECLDIAGPRGVVYRLSIRTISTSSLTRLDILPVPATRSRGKEQTTILTFGHLSALARKFPRLRSVSSPPLDADPDPDDALAPAFAWTVYPARQGVPGRISITESQPIPYMNIPGPFSPPRFAPPPLEEVRDAWPGYALEYRGRAWLPGRSAVSGIPTHFYSRDRRDILAWLHGTDTHALTHLSELCVRDLPCELETLRRICVAQKQEQRPITRIEATQLAPITVDELADFAEACGRSLTVLKLAFRDQHLGKTLRISVKDLPSVVAIVRRHLPALRVLSLHLDGGDTDTGAPVVHDRDIPISHRDYGGQLERITLRLSDGSHRMITLDGSARKMGTFGIARNLACLADRDMGCRVDVTGDMVMLGMKMGTMQEDVRRTLTWFQSQDPTCLARLKTMDLAKLGIETMDDLLSTSFESGGRPLSRWDRYEARWARLKRRIDDARLEWAHSYRGGSRWWGEYECVQAFDEEMGWEQDWRWKKWRNKRRDGEHVKEEEGESSEVRCAQQ